MPVVGPASEYLRAKTCPLLASSTARTSPEHERAGAARASRVEFFAREMPVPGESARTVAAAMRMPVKVPGPTPASTHPTEPRSCPARPRTACTAGSNVSEAPRVVAGTSASTSWAFSRATVGTGGEASTGRGPHEGGLAGSDLAGEHDDITRTEHPRDPGCQPLEHSLLEAFELHRRSPCLYQSPGWTGSRSASGERVTFRVS